MGSGLRGRFWAGDAVEGIGLGWTSVDEIREPRCGAQAGSHAMEADGFGKEVGPMTTSPIKTDYGWSACILVTKLASTSSIEKEVTR